MPLLTEYPQWYCEEIPQLLTFLSNLFCPKAYRPDHSICIIEYHRKLPLLSLNLTSSPRLEPTSSRVSDLGSCNLLAETNNFVLWTVLLSWLVSELQKPSSSGLEPRTVFRFCCHCFYNLKQLWSWQSSVFLSFQDTETTLTGFRIQDTFSEFWHF
jgi:hypothetical protein